uniref:Uncharacterized protein n=1 Tax=Anguilla anguilla TaxID=7936 RepID=A0A0E9TX28_ANGAN
MCTGNTLPKTVLRNMSKLQNNCWPDKCAPMPGSKDFL